MTARRNALVTGCSTGIGRASALDLVQRGWRVFATVRRAEDAGALCKAAEHAENLIPVLLDVTDPESIESAGKQVSDALAGEPLHGLVQNAGIANFGPLEVMPIDFFTRQLDVNLTGVLRVTQAMLPLMRQGDAPKGSRTIVMISSINGQVGTPLGGAYCASKFGLEGLSDTLRRELLSQEIDVVVVEPGAIETAIWETSKRRAEGLMPELEANPAMPLYRRFIDSMMERVRRIEKQAIPAERVAVVITRSLERPRPAVRVRVGNDAIVGYLLQRILPTRLFDKLVVHDMTRST